jgi:tetratricopeptide (TPR) repeat protein
MKNHPVLTLADLEAEHPALANRLNDEVTKGQEEAENALHDSALNRLLSCWSSLPEPKSQWQLYSNWISTSLFNVNMSLKRFDDARHWAGVALECRSTSQGTREFVYLGEAALELGEGDVAYEWFNEAFELGGRRAFQGENSKYLNFYLKEKEKKR